MSGRNKSVGFAVLSIVLVLAAGLVVSGCGGGAAPKPAKVYKVTFEASGGEPVPEAQLVEAGSKIELPKTMARTKFTFSGWYKDLDCTEPWNFARDTVEGDIILFANWKPTAGKSGGGGGGGSSGNSGGPSGSVPNSAASITVTFDINDGSTPTTSVNVAKGASLGTKMPSSPKKTGGYFFGWNTDEYGKGNAFTSKTAVTASITVYAMWTPPEYNNPPRDGEGPDTAFLVSTPDALRFIGKGDPDPFVEEHKRWILKDKYYELTDDIDMINEDPFDPIGSDSFPFKGFFDGKGHVIANLTINPSNPVGEGMFGVVGDDSYLLLTGVHPARVTGVTLVNCYLNCYNPLAAGMVGSNYGTVEYCNVIGGIIIGDTNVGGVVGFNWGKVQNCYATGSVSAYANAGGVVGRNVTGTVEYCYATGSVSADANVGGVVGNNYDTVQNCVALNTSVTLTSVTFNLGRVVGYNDGGGTLTNNYARDGLNPSGSSWSLLVDDDTAVDGKTIYSIDWGSSSWWTTPANWDTAAWDAAIWDFSSVGASSYPVLRPPTP